MYVMEYSSDLMQINADRQPYISLFYILLQLKKQLMLQKTQCFKNGAWKLWSDTVTKSVRDINLQYFNTDVEKIYNSHWKGVLLYLPEVYISTIQSSGSIMIIIVSLGYRCIYINTICLIVPPSYWFNKDNDFVWYISPA